MLRVFVLGKNQDPLMPCHPARARKLLALAKARVFKLHPFTIILTEREEGVTQEVEQKIDPGSRTTGISLVASFKEQTQVIFALHLNHRGHHIKDALDARRGQRRGRRSRKCRYRKPRFLNRTRPAGWLPPSLTSRIDNVFVWSKKLLGLCPFRSLAVETVRFDMQKLENPEIQGTEYQKGCLFGYEVREYLLEKWQRKCVYCGAKNVRLEIEHIKPKSRGGSDRVSNLAIACQPCNQRKGHQPVEKFVSDPKLLAKILRQAKAPLKDAAAVNATRIAIGDKLKPLGLNMTFWSGGRTKFNRRSQDYPKDHWIDAACVGQSGCLVYLDPRASPLSVTADGRGSRQKCRVDRYGFPRTTAKTAKRVKGFQTGDIVKAVVLKGKKKGTYVGRVAVRTSGYFNIKIGQTTVQGIGYKDCRILQRLDGYSYAIEAKRITERTSVSTLTRRFSPKGFSFPPPPEGGDFQEKV